MPIASNPGENGPPEDEAHSREEDSTLGGDPLDLATPVGSLRVAGDGEALKGLVLEGAGERAERAQDGELPAGVELSSLAKGDASSDGRHVDEWLVGFFGCCVWC